MPSMSIESPFRITGLFPKNGFALACEAGEVGVSELFEEEFALVEHAVSKRQREFAAGRMLARRALAGLGVEPAAILRDAHGAPVWREGCIGSITHTQGRAAAVAARRGRVRGLGLDMECRSRPFPWQALNLVALPAEQAWLDGLPADWREIAVFCLFSAKESLIKCLYSAGLPLHYFTQLAVRLDLARGCFEICESSAVAAPNAGLKGRLGWDRDYVFTGAWWPEQL